jgi:MinD-like ATPase involved in chromosome partitioning or flagellar assembly
VTTIALAGCKGSPGVTTLAMALAVARARQEGSAALLVEADPAGGTIAARCGLRLDPGLATLAASARRSIDAAMVDRHAQLLPSGTRVLLAPTSAQHTGRALRALSAALASALEAEDGSVLLDVGRWAADSPAADLLACASLTILVLRPTIEGVEHARWQLEALSRTQRRVVPVTVGDRPYPPDEVMAALSVNELYTVDHEPRAARALASPAQPDRWLRRSRLLRSAAAFGKRIFRDHETAEVAQ